MLGATAALVATALQLFDTQAPRFAGLSAWAIGAGLVAAAAFVAALRAR